MKINKRTLLAAALPVFFAFITIFFTYRNIGVFLVSGLVLVIVEAVLITSGHKQQRSSSKKNWLSSALPLMLITVGAIGLSAATTLTREKIELLSDPNYAPSCSISPIVACSPIIGSEQASVFGIPNPLLGVFGYGALLIAGFSLLAGGNFAAWWWKTLWIGSALGLAFCAWLIYTSLYVIGALCIFCMVAWALTVFIFNYITVYCLENKYLRLPASLQKLYLQNHAAVLTILYGFVLLLIYFEFDYYWRSLI